MIAICKAPAFSVDGVLSLPDGVPSEFANWMAMETGRLLANIGVRTWDITIKTNPVFAYSNHREAAKRVREDLIWPAIMGMIFG